MQNKNKIMKERIKRNFWYVLMVSGIGLLASSLMQGETFAWQIPSACGLIILSLIMESATNE
jgi:putative copper export protein